MVTQQFEQRTRELIDSLKAICAAYGLGNDGNEFKIITQVFLYKFLNDKFAFEAKKTRPELPKAESWEAAIAAMNADDLDMLQMQMGADTARLKPEHFIAHLWSRQTAPEFAKLFDDTLRDIAITNNDIFAVKTDGGTKITLFDRVSEFITDPSKRDAFCRAIINKLGDFSFERIFNEKYDFYAALFEYLSTHIKYPTIAEENGVQGRVIVTFVVERDGSITDVKVVKSVVPSLDKEASRVVAGMPKWIPGKQNGSAVRVKYTVPVTFRLQ